MIISLALLLIVTASGALATYFYDDGASLGARICAGACIGLTALGLTTFCLASYLGRTPVTIAIATVLVLLPCLVWTDPLRRQVIRSELSATLLIVRRV